MSIETHKKIVKGKTVLVPSMELFKQYLPKEPGPVDTAAMRVAMKSAYGTQMVCPVTMRLHIKALGLTIKKK